MTRYMIYAGTAHRRVITVRDWRRAGVQEQGMVIWSKANGFLVNVDEAMTDEALGKLASDPNLVLFEAANGAELNRMLASYRDAQRTSIRDRVESAMAAVDAADAISDGATAPSTADDADDDDDGDDPGGNLAGAPPASGAAGSPVHSGE